MRVLIIAVALSLLSASALGRERHRHHGYVGPLRTLSWVTRCGFHRPYREYRGPNLPYRCG
jgi:hypothetical protein